MRRRPDDIATRRTRTGWLRGVTARSDRLPNSYCDGTVCD
jgi:hypothetical protein